MTEPQFAAAGDDTWDLRQVLETAFQESPSAMVLTTPEGTILAVNHRFAALVQRDAEELPGLGLSAVTPIGDDPPARRVARAAARGEREPFRFVQRFLLPDGELVTADVGVSEVHDAAGRLLGILFQVHSAEGPSGATAPPRKADGVASAEAGRPTGASWDERADRRRRLVDVLARLQDAVLAGRPQDELFEQACRFAVQDVGLRMAWIGALDGTTIVPQAHAGVGFEQIESSAATANVTQPVTHGPTAMACRRGVPIVIRDLQGSPTAGRWRDLAAAHGLRSSASFPLIVRGRVLGVLSVYAAQRDFFGSGEIDLLERLATTLGFGWEMALRSRALTELRSERAGAEAVAASVLDATEDGVLIQAADGRIISANDVAARILGVTTSALVGRSSYDETVAVLGTDGRFVPREQRHSYRTLQTGQDFTRVPATVRNATTGQLQSVLVSTRLITDPVAGEDRAVVVTFTDVTERRALEVAQQEAEERLHTVVSNAPLALTVIDGQGRITLHEGHALARVGMRPGELVGESVWDRFGDVPDVRAALEVAYGGQPSQATVAIAGFVWDVRYQPVLDQTGAVSQVVAIGMDVTDVRLLEQERIRLLERSVSAVEEERRRLSQNLHDDAIQLLTAALLRIGLVDETAGRDRNLAAVRDLVLRANRSLRTAVLELHPPELGEAGLHDALETYVDRVLRAARPDIEVVMDVEPDLAPTGPVSTATYRIVLEALSNAARHADPSRVELSLSAADGWLVGTVLDDGVGIREDTEPVPGHIGLRSMRDRAAVVGGSLKVVRRPSGGTAVHFRLPLPDRGHLGDPRQAEHDRS